MKQARSEMLHDRLDRVGSWISLGCAIHCALMPLLLLAIPAAGLGAALGEGVEAWISAVAVTLAGFSVGWGCVRHRRFRALWPLVAGASLLGGARWFDLEESWVELAIVVGGGLLLALSHRMNRQLCAACPSCKEGEDGHACGGR